MRLIVQNIECYNERIYVIGATNVGSIKELWRYKEAPVIGQEYFFELSIGEIDRNKISVICGEDLRSEVSLNDECMHFKGICEEIDDIYVVRFSVDWIEMIAIKNDDFTIKKGDGVSFSVQCKDVGIYPY